MSPSKSPGILTMFDPTPSKANAIVYMLLEHKIGTSYA
jgi:hypothetical protein